MRSNLYAFVCLSAFTLFIAGCTGTKEPNSSMAEPADEADGIVETGSGLCNTTDWKTWTDAVSGFSVKYPPDLVWADGDPVDVRFGPIDEQPQVALLTNNYEHADWTGDGFAMVILVGQWERSLQDYLDQGREGGEGKWSEALSHGRASILSSVNLQGYKTIDATLVSETNAGVVERFRWVLFEGRIIQITSFTSVANSAELSETAWIPVLSACVWESMRLPTRP